MEIVPLLFAAVAIVSFACEYTDASIGMGYGTTLSPVLLIIGFAPLEVVPAVLLGQLVGGLVGGLAHHRLGNISLDFRRDDRLVKERLHHLGYLQGVSYVPRSFDSKVIFILAICGIIGALVGVFSALNVPKVILQTYIGVMVLGIGLLILIRGRRQNLFSWKNLVGVGLLSAFNKGMSGGGYGPLVTGGQIISGRETRNSVGSTTLAEAVVCIVGFSAYVLFKGNISWTLAAATGIGSIVAAPLAALTVRKLDSKRLKHIIALATIALGILTLVKVAAP